MKVNEINLANSPKVESDTDALHILRTQAQLDYYIQQFGNVEVEWDETHKIYRVPSLNEKRQAYCGWKAKEVSVWGSN